MAYTITKSDGTVLLYLNDKTTQTKGGITLVGRGQTQYGEEINENFVKMLEHFANTSPHAEALLGQLWYDTSTQSVKVKVNVAEATSSWKNVNSASHSGTAPSNPINGDLWYDTTSAVQKLKLYTGAQWKEIGPYVPPTGDTEIAASANSGNAILLVKIANTIVAIFSNVEFTPAPEIVGFSKLYPGLNLRTLGALSTSSVLINNRGIVPTVDNDKVLGTSDYRVKEIWAADFKGNTTSSTSSVNATNADNIKITATNANATHYPTLVTGLSGYSGVNVDSNLSYNASTNTLEVTASVKTGILESTVATGTAPIKVASTTKVANLTAEKADQWSTARTVTFAGGDVSGNFTIDGSTNVGSVELTVSQTNFATPTSVTTAINNLLPAGSIILWYGNYSTVPTGWAICDGNNGTPNLTNKFVVGAAKDINNVPVTDIEGTNKTTGGTAHTVLPVHSHSITDKTHTHNAQKQNTGDWQGTPEAVAISKDNFDYYAGDRSPDGNIDGSRYVTGYDRNTVPINLSQSSTGITGTNSTGADPNFTNIPPYYTLYYIMRKFA